jgi:quercetin dioxygenase-like cupin family protein
MIRAMLITLAAFAAISAADAQQSGIERQQLLQRDGPGDFQTLVVMLQFAPAAREVRHTHPGAVAGYVLDGTLTLEHEGRPTTKYNAGQAFYVEPGKVHLAINETNAPLKFLATLVVEKGKPPSSPAP